MADSTARTTVSFIVNHHDTGSAGLATANTARRPRSATSAVPQILPTPTAEQGDTDVTHEPEPEDQRGQLLQLAAFGRILARHAAVPELVRHTGMTVGTIIGRRR